MEIVTRKEAIERGLKRYFTGKPCKYGHISEKVTSSATCCECQSLKKQTPEYKEKVRQHNELTKEYRKERYRNNRRQILEKQREYVLRNWEKVSKRTAAMRATDEFKKYRKEYVDKNRAKIYEYNALRRAAKSKGCPQWLTKSDRAVISAIYEMAGRLTSCLGILHHVDHIVPLRGKHVCGLHVPWNLAAIPAKINMKKHNKLLIEPSSKDQGE